MNNRVRQQFPALQQRINGQPLCYLDSAATAQKPMSVITAVQQFYRRENANVHRAGYQLAAIATDKFESARAQVAAFFGMAANELVWTKGCTESINLVAHSWALGHICAHDRMLVSGLEHHANLVPWQQVCKATGAHLDIIPVQDSGELDLNAYQELLQHKPKLVAISHVSNALGTVNPLHTMISQAKAVGAIVLVDGAQAAAHLAIDVPALGADFYVFSGHKMYGPTGIGGLLAKPCMLEQFEPWQTGGEMVETVSYQEATWAPLPYRLEAGTPNIAGAIGLAKATEFMTQLSSDWRQQESDLLAYLRFKLSQLPYIQLIGNAAQQVAVQSFVSVTMHAQDVAQYLDQSGVAVRVGKHCAHPLLDALGVDATLRASLACYSTEQDVDQLIAALEFAHTAEALPNTIEQHWNEKSALWALGEAKGWQHTLKLLIELGRALPPELQANKEQQYWINGCESSTWLMLELDDQHHKLCCKVESEANVIRGVLHVLALHFNTLNSKQQASFDGAQWLTNIGIVGQLSTTRNQGMRAVMQQLHAAVGAV